MHNQVQPFDGYQRCVLWCTVYMGVFLSVEGTTLARPSYAAPGTVAGMTLASTGFTHPGLHPTNKFNTISNVHKRGGRQPGKPHMTLCLLPAALQHLNPMLVWY